MGLDVLKIILLHRNRDDCLDMLNLLGKGDISKESFENTIDYAKGIPGDLPGTTNETSITN